MAETSALRIGLGYLHLRREDRRMARGVFLGLLPEAPFVFCSGYE
ncbi:MAG: hypothetical protein V4759_14505 [Pseudomonadota bacterium]